MTVNNGNFWLYNAEPELTFVGTGIVDPDGRGNTWYWLTAEPGKPLCSD